MSTPKKTDGNNSPAAHSETAGNKSGSDKKEKIQLVRFGRYLLLDHLVDGGMAKICRARHLDEQTNKMVAIKMIRPQYSQDPAFKKMFMDEIKVAFGLIHPNIVQTYDYGILNGQLYTAIEYIDGKNLKQFLDRLKEKKFVFPVEISVHIISQTCQALSYAHTFTDKLTGKSFNIIHRDISPHNIMLSYDGAIKVIDFGIAKANTNSEETQAGTIKGKISYLAPEYLDGMELDHRYDQFAVGITLWEMLCSRKLFHAENELAILKKIQNCKVPTPSSINPNVPKELDQIVLKSLSKDRNNRYENMDQFNRALVKFLYSTYPDFNATDLNYFSKELFKDDINKDREKLVEFGKIDITPYLNDLKKELEGKGTNKSGEQGTSNSEVSGGEQSDRTERTTQRRVVIEFDDDSKDESALTLGNLTLDRDNKGSNRSTIRPGVVKGKPLPSATGSVGPADKKRLGEHSSGVIKLAKMNGRLSGSSPTNNNISEGSANSAHLSVHATGHPNSPNHSSPNAGTGNSINSAHSSNNPHANNTSGTASGPAHITRTETYPTHHTGSTPPSVPGGAGANAIQNKRIANSNATSDKTRIGPATSSSNRTAPSNATAESLSRNNLSNPKIKMVVGVAVVLVLAVGIFYYFKTPSTPTTLNSGQVASNDSNPGANNSKTRVISSIPGQGTGGDSKENPSHNGLKNGNSLAAGGTGGGTEVKVKTKKIIFSNANPYQHFFVNNKEVSYDNFSFELPINTDIKLRVEQANMLPIFMSFQLTEDSPHTWTLPSTGMGIFGVLDANDNYPKGSTLTFFINGHEITYALPFTGKKVPVGKYEATIFNSETGINKKFNFEINEDIVTRVK